MSSQVLLETEYEPCHLVKRVPVPFRGYVFSVTPNLLLNDLCFVPIRIVDDSFVILDLQAEQCAGRVHQKIGFYEQVRNTRMGQDWIGDPAYDKRMREELISVLLAAHPDSIHV